MYGHKNSWISQRAPSRPAKPGFGVDVLLASVATLKIPEAVRRTDERVHERTIEQLGEEESDQLGRRAGRR